ncbi:DUF805 domain-containing protein [Xanthobacter pseudotagetidis]|uniref:DUF805 domain-containing protein n=1 Tax=Xanthobacter pseudotagetidis TaxID=3119911 RepID=UPI00372BDF05
MTTGQRIDWIFLLASFRGRISRRQFWAGLGVLAALGAGLALAAHLVPALATAAAAVAASLLLPLAALATKRWHDRNRSGCRSLVVLIPVAGLAYLVYELGFVAGMSGRYGPRVRRPALA